MKRPLEKIDTSSLQIDKGAYEHFMLKEIYESSKVLTDIFRGRIDFHELKIVAEELGKFRDDTISMIEFVACGTSYHAGLLASYWIEELAVGMNTRVTIASEFFSRPPKISTDTLFVFISQSGETADSIEPLKYLRERGARTLGIVNVVGSTIARMADTTIFTRAGIEVGVASTKAFMGQTGALLLLCLYFCVHSGADYRVYRSLIAEVASLPGLAHATLLLSSEIQKIAQDFTQYSHLFFIGRGSSYAVALEGALKFKEITYAHAHAIPAGELKHGSLALIDAHCPSVIYIPNDTNYRQNLSTIEEIRARGGKVLAIAETPISIADWNIIVPSSNPYFYGIIASIASQLFAYHTAKLLGRDIDKPRNLAKSVTVK